MKKQYIRIIYHAAILLFVNCAALGTSIKIAEIDKLNQIKTVFINSKQYETELTEAIEKTNIFKISNDSTNADAILNCEIEYRHKREEVCAKANIYIIDKVSNIIIGQVIYDTFYGNSYLIQLSEEKATLDAIYGAINGLFKKINKGNS